MFDLFTDEQLSGSSYVLPGNKLIDMSRKTASDQLDDYINEFEGKTPTRHYTRRVTNLSAQSNLGPYSIIESKQEKMSNDNHDLLNWVNASYKDNLKSTCKPLYDQHVKTRPIPNSQSDGLVEAVSDISDDIRHKITIDLTEADDLSSLPSPGGSVVELDSDQETVVTDLLLSSYYENSDKKAISIVKEKDSGKQYPSWVERINQPLDKMRDDKELRRFSSVSSLLKTTPRGGDKSGRHYNGGLTMDDTESVNTDIVLETSVYGEIPVNMGGTLHTPLFKDKRVQKMLNESRTKNKTSRESFLRTQMHGLSSNTASRPNNIKSTSSPQSRDVLYTRKLLKKHHINDSPSNPGIEITQKNYKKLQDYERVKTSKSGFSNNSPSHHSKTSSGTYGGNRGLGNVRSLHERDIEMKRIAKYSENRESDPRDNLRMVVDNKLQARPNQTYLNPNKSYPSTLPLDQNSQRTSGYHSDIHLASPTSTPAAAMHNQLLDPEMQRALPFYKKANLISRRDSDHSERSTSTDKLMRQSPTGTRIHKRSKTWNDISAHRRVPMAISTPKVPYNFANQKNDPILSRGTGLTASQQGRSFGTTSRTSTSSATREIDRRAPSSSPHSQSQVRAYIQSKSQFSKSPLLSDDLFKHEKLHISDDVNRTQNSFNDKQKKFGRYSDSILTRTSNQPDFNRDNRELGYSHWQSTRSKPDRYVMHTVEASEKYDNTEVSSESYHSETLNEIYDSSEKDIKRLAELEEELDGTVEELSNANRTWPSLEKYKQRVRSFQTRVGDHRSSPQYYGWAKEKQSIPLRSSNSFKTDSNFDRIQSHGSPDYGRRSWKSTARTESLGQGSIQLNIFDNQSSLPREKTEEAHYHDNDHDSTTADTELLLIQPPLPIVDVSPSLSTVSDDSTIVDSQSEAESQIYPDLPQRSSSRVSFAPDPNFSGKGGLSPVRAFNNRPFESNPTKESVLKSVQEESTKNLNSTLSGESKAMKSELLDSFINDCMRSTNGMTHQELASPNKNAKKNPKLSGRDHPGTVETLKHMLLNLNGVADNQPVNAQGRKIFEESEAVLQDTEDTTDETSSLPGEQSLTRAYHHLARLKSLINNRAEFSSDNSI